MCAAAIMWAGIGRIVFGSSIAFVEAHGIHQINISVETVVKASDFGASTVVAGGVLSNETDPLYTTSAASASSQHGHAHSLADM
jgi:tRNA(adenine34) deaminase